jgi:hypothetical protein
VTADEIARVPPLVYLQAIRMEAGIGVLVIGANMHVFGDGVPLYLLEERNERS